jgi:hypothetical protein
VNRNQEVFTINEIFVYQSCTGLHIECITAEISMYIYHMAQDEGYQPVDRNTRVLRIYEENNTNEQCKIKAHKNLYYDKNR